jgi:hypothetical protein
MAEIPTAGVFFGIQRALHQVRAQAHTQTWACHYEGGDSHPLAYYPTCPANEGETSSMVNIWLQTGPGHGPLEPTRPHVARLLLLRHYDRGGNYGFGMSVKSAAVIDGIGAVGLWIPFGP